MLIAINLIAFQIGWFACVIGASKGIFWLGPLVVSVVFAVHLFFTRNFLREIALGLIISFVGFLTDTLLTEFNVYSPLPYYIAPPWSPPWLIFMWLNFATLMNVSIKWLGHNYMLSALLGGIGGALAYYSGNVFGALHYFEPLLTNILITGIVWAGLTPLFFYISNQLKKYLETHN
jgi:hypothetical protein